METNAFDNINKMLPHSYLWLYAKGWLRFKDTNNSFVEDMKKIVLWEYASTTENPTGHILNSLYSIKEFFRKNNIELPREWDDFGYFYRQANSRIYKDYGNVTALEIGMMKEVYGMLQIISIPKDCWIKRIDYKKFNCICAGYHNGMTFKEMQKNFDNTFEKHFDKDYSYDVPFCLSIYNRI